MYRSKPERREALRSYPTSSATRSIKRGQRSLANRLVAAQRSAAFFDGPRDQGYGGLRYDGRWAGVATDLINDYELPSTANILHVQCEKGFLLHELKSQLPQSNVLGTETSPYAIATAHGFARGHIQEISPTHLPFPDDSFNLVVALGVAYTLTLADAVSCMREIQRLAAGDAFITLASYEEEWELDAMREWSLLGNLILREQEWVEVMSSAEYVGTYDLVTARKLGVSIAE